MTEANGAPGDPEIVKILEAAGWAGNNLAAVVGNLEIAKAWLMHNPEWPALVDVEQQSAGEEPTLAAAPMVIPRFRLDELHRREYEIKDGDDIDEIMAHWVDCLDEANSEIPQDTPRPRFFGGRKATRRDGRCRRR